MLSSSINDPHNYKSEADLKKNTKEKEKAINTEISIAEKVTLILHLCISKYAMGGHGKPVDPD